MILRGYVVDKNKNNVCRYVTPDGYVLLGSGKKVSAVKPGEFLSQEKVKKMGCTKSDFDNLLVKVSIDEKNLTKYGKQLFPSFGKKYCIADKNYKPNRLNYNNYKH